MTVAPEVTAAAWVLNDPTSRAGLYVTPIGWSFWRSVARFMNEPGAVAKTPAIVGPVVAAAVGFGALVITSRPTAPSWHERHARETGPGCAETNMSMVALFASVYIV